MGDNDFAVPVQSEMEKVYCKFGNRIKHIDQKSSLCYFFDSEVEDDTVREDLTPRGLREASTGIH